jgi:hypothetical protein
VGTSAWGIGLEKQRLWVPWRIFMKDRATAVSATVHGGVPARIRRLMTSIDRLSMAEQIRIFREPCSEVGKFLSGKVDGCGGRI